ncbi:MAG: flagellar hook-length control protein FliK [Thermodesulfobacteriota bacterium]
MRLHELGRGKAEESGNKDKDLAGAEGALEDKAVAAQAKRKKMPKSPHKDTGSLDEAQGGFSSSKSLEAGKDLRTLLKQALSGQTSGQGPHEKNSAGLEVDGSGGKAQGLAGREVFSPAPSPSPSTTTSLRVGLQGHGLNKGALFHMAEGQVARRAALVPKGEKSPARGRKKIFSGGAPRKDALNIKRGEAGKVLQEGLKRAPSNEVPVEKAMPLHSHGVVKDIFSMAVLKGASSSMEASSGRPLAGEVVKEKAMTGKRAKKSAAPILRRGRHPVSARNLPAFERQALSGKGSQRKVSGASAGMEKGEGVTKINGSKDTGTLSFEGAAGQGLSTPGLAAAAAGPLQDSSAETLLNSAMGGAGLTEARGKSAAAANLRQAVMAGKRGSELIKTAAKGVVMSLNNRDKEIVIALKPEELGQMEIKVRIEDGLVETSILVDNPHVMAMINADTVSLKELLARQGIMAGGLDVALNNGSDTFFGQDEEFHGHGNSPHPAGSGVIKEDNGAGQGREIHHGYMDESFEGRKLDLFI